MNEPDNKPENKYERHNRVLEMLLELVENEDADLYYRLEASRLLLAYNSGSKQFEALRRPGG